MLWNKLSKITIHSSKNNYKNGILSKNNEYMKVLKLEEFQNYKLIFIKIREGT